MHEIKLPQMGQSVEEASIVQWLKKEGDPVEQGEVLFTIQTDKAEVECEAPASGILRKILLEPDVLMPVMSVIGLIGEKDEPLPDLGQYASGGSAPATPEPAPAAVEETPQPVTVASTPVAPAAASGSAVSPRARKRAAALGVDPTTISGTGAGGRVIEADVIAGAGQAQEMRMSPTARRVAELSGVDVSGIQGSGARGKIMKDDVLQAAAQPAKPAAPAGPGKVIPHSPMRRIIAQRMCESKFSAPHFYITLEVDMSKAMAFRKQIVGYKASVNDLVLRAAVLALRQWPAMNARWGDDAITELEDINLGVATALPTGLIVPVIKRAQNLSLEGISKEARSLVEKARNGKLLPDDYSGNSFTVTNIGVYGIDEFVAIINQPDSAILAVGAIKDRVVVIDGGICIRPIMKLTLSSDHRVIDGALAAQFMGCLKETLETATF